MISYNMKIRGQLPKRSFWFVIISVGLFLSVFSSNVLGKNLVKYYTDNEGNVSFYDKDSVQRASGIVKVWVKDIWGNKMKRLKKGISIKGYEKLSYTMTLFEVNCNDDTYHVLKHTDYDSNGNALYVFPQYSDWSHIVPGSNGYVLKIHVCR